MPAEFADEEYFQEEYSRRSIQINSLRDELWDLRDRTNDATERTTFLQQSITRLTGELSIRKAKANEMEDKTALEQAKAEELARHLAADASTSVAEVAQLRHQMADLDQAYLAVKAENEEAQGLLAQKQAELGAMRVVLEARSRDAERARNELAQEQAKEEARQERLAVHYKERGTEQVKDAEGRLAAAASEAANVRAELLRLERSLMAERDCTAGLEKALRHTVEQQELTTEEANALEAELEVHVSSAEEGNLADLLAASRLKCQYLSQDLGNARRHCLLQTQSIQGAIEETQRMMGDHLDQTRNHMDVTQCTNDSSLAVLTSTLAEAKSRTASGISAWERLERERTALEEDLRKMEVAAAAEAEGAGRDRVARMEEELGAARSALDACNRRANQAAEEARRAETAAVEAECATQDEETFLRSKLEELWHMIGAINTEKHSSAGLESLYLHRVSAD